MQGGTLSLTLRLKPDNAQVLFATAGNAPPGTWEVAAGVLKPTPAQATMLRQLWHAYAGRAQTLRYRTALCTSRGCGAVLRLHAAAAQNVLQCSVLQCSAVQGCARSTARARAGFTVALAMVTVPAHRASALCAFLHPSRMQGRAHRCAAGCADRGAAGYGVLRRGRSRDHGCGVTARSHAEVGTLLCAAELSGVVACCAVLCCTVFAPAAMRPACLAPG